MLNRQTKNHDQQNRKLIRIINYLTFLHSQNLFFVWNSNLTSNIIIESLKLLPKLNRMVKVVLNI